MSMSCRGGARPPLENLGNLVRRFRALSLGLAAFVFPPGPAMGQTLASTARQLSPRAWKINVHYQGTRQQDLNFRLTTANVCAGGGAANPAFGCGASGDVASRVDSGAVLLQAAYQPWDSFQYYAYCGAGDQRLELGTNVLTGDRPGYLYGAGARAVVLPDTAVNPAVAIDGRFGWERYYFNEVRPAAAAAAGQIDQRLDLYRTQVAVLVSHLFDFSRAESDQTFAGLKIEPYGGVKWLRTQAYIKDLQGGGRIGGMADTFTPLIGLQVPVYDHEALTTEISFVDGIQYSAGLQVKF